MVTVTASEQRTKAILVAEREILRARMATMEQRLNGHDLRHLHILARAVDQSANLVFITDAGGTIEYVNDRFTQTTGYSREEAIGQNPRLLNSGETPPEAYKVLWETILAGEEWQGEFHNTKKDGTHYWASATISPITDDDSNVTHFLAIQEDITKRKEAEAAESDQRALAEALRDSAEALTSTLNREQVLDRILDNIETVVHHDAAEIMLLTGDVAQVVRSHGYEERGLAEAISQLRLLLPETRNLRLMVETGEPVVIPDTREYEGWIPHSPTEWTRSHVGAPIRLEQEVVGFLSLSSAEPDYFSAEHAARLQAFADQAAIAIRNARLFSDLEMRNRELDAFSHTIAHDLKTPLNLIVGNAELVAMDVDPDAPYMQEALTSIQQSALGMADMIDQLLLLATVRDAGKIVGRVDVEPVVAAAVAHYRKQIDERGIQVEVAPDLPPVLGHGPWLEEVFANLIGNAVKYIGADNPEPRIVVRGSVRDDCVRYEVRDNGIGMQPDDIPHVFEMFTRFHSREASGLGLGLSIVEHIISKLNGAVGVESAPGDGTTFWFWLPAPD